MGDNRTKQLTRIDKYVDSVLAKYPDFTGKLELNFQNGHLQDINQTVRTKFDKRN